MKLGWGMVAGLGMAGLLVAAPAIGQTGSTGSSTGSSGSSTSGGSSERSGSSTMGQPPSSGSSTGSTTGGQTGTMGSSSERSSSTAMGSSQNQVTGKVQKLDKSKKELTLALPVSESTQVTKNGQSATLNDIKEGDQVRASFSGSGDTLQVTSIEVISKGSTAPGSTAPSKGGSSGMGTGSSGSSTGSSGSSTGSSGQSEKPPPGKGY